jgi:putative ABC transport system ATP-binding protein
MEQSPSGAVAARPSPQDRLHPNRGVQPVVRVQGVCHFFGQGETRKQVLFDNHLELHPGEIVIMTGPSGSGKTTLLTLIGGLRTMQDGAIQVLGQAYRDLNEKQLVLVRRGIGFIFQAHNLFASLTAYQNVRMALELSSYSKQEMHDRVVELLTELGLGHRIHYKPEALSGGQRQRVAIARALANRPKLILADEPTAALDKKSGRDVVNLLQRLAREHGCTSIIVTHDNRILDVADRIVNMVDGHIVSNVLLKESEVICEFLSKVPSFADLTTDMLTYVAERMVKESFAPGSVVIRQGDPGERFYLIRAGAAEVAITDDDGTTRVVRQLKAGDFFGEMALLANKPRSATVTATEELDTYTLDKKRFDEVLCHSETFKEQLRKVYFLRQ